jgi:hypothetical protein
MEPASYALGAMAWAAVQWSRENVWPWVRYAKERGVLDRLLAGRRGRRATDEIREGSGVSTG